MEEKTCEVKIKLVLDAEAFKEELKALEKEIDPILKKIEKINSKT